MKLSEKQRLIALTCDAVKGISNENPKVRDRAIKASEKYSPTNAASYRELAEIVWWLIATDAREDAMRLLDALCEVDDEHYWMFDAVASSFAARAWLHAEQKNAIDAQHDAQKALQWLRHDPNPKVVSDAEIQKTFKKFDDWLTRANSATGTMTAVQVLSHAMRVLVIYKGIAEAGDPAAKGVSAQEYTSRFNSGLEQLRHRLEAW